MLKFGTTEIPENGGIIKYNGTDITQVIFSNGSTSTTVWTRQDKIWIVQNGTVKESFTKKKQGYLRGADSTYNSYCDANTGISGNSIYATYKGDSDDDNYTDRYIYAYFNKKIASANTMHYKFTFSYTHYYVCASGTDPYGDKSSRIVIGARSNLDATNPYSDTTGKYFTIFNHTYYWSENSTEHSWGWYCNPQKLNGSGYDNSMSNKTYTAEGTIDVSSLSNFYPFVYLGCAEYGDGAMKLTANVVDLWFE